MSEFARLHWFTLGDVARESRRSYPTRTAVVDGDVRLSYVELDDRVNQLAHALSAAGVTGGDRVLWLGQNSFRVLELLLAAAKVGAILCPANWRQSADEMAVVIEDCMPRVVVWQEDEIGATVRAARDRVTASASTGDVLWLQHDTAAAGASDAAAAAAGDAAADADGYEGFLASGDRSDPDLAIDPSTPVLMLYTAAFSGRPAGACLSHTAVLVQDLVMGNLQRIDSDYVFLNSGPLFHVATLMTTLATLHFGGTNVFVRRVDADEICRLIATERCTGAFLMGPTIEQITELNRDGAYDLSSLRTFPGRPEWNAMVTVDDSPWAKRPAGFGQTEVMGMLTLNAWGGDAAGSSGRPGPLAQVRIVSPDGDEVPPGSVGEIVARGPTMMTGYHGQPELTAARQADGWHHTNDLGRREDDGSITWVGPKTRLIKSAAENIYPAEVEAALHRHAAVRDVGVIGVPDARWTQSVRAIVVLHDGVEATEEELIEHCMTLIASYKKPRSVRFTDAMPRNGPAIDYDALDAAFGGGGYPSSA
ncbi:MAG: AMP-binding protein [Acidimicrobiales bacterium]